MKIPKTRSAILMAFAAVMVSIVTTGNVAYAATAAKTPPAAPPVTNANVPIKISPVRTDVSIEKGTTKKVTTYVTNLSAQPTVYKAIENDFIAGDESGKASLILDENSYAPTHSLKRFMVPIPDITVEPGQTKQVDVTINVPATAQSGGYFGALRFAPKSPNGTSTVGLNGSAASLILLTVPGDLVEALQLTHFDIQQNGGTANNFRTPDNLEVLLRFKNTGNVQVAPFGTVTVSKGKKVIYKKDFNTNDKKDNVLPDSARRWTIPIKNLSKFGKYDVQGNFTYGTQGKTIEIKKTIWIVPTTYIFIGLGIIAVLLLIIVLIISLIKAKRGGGKRSRRYY